MLYVSSVPLTDFSLDRLSLRFGIIKRLKSKQSILLLLLPTTACSGFLLELRPLILHPVSRKLVDDEANSLTKELAISIAFTLWPTCT